METTQCNIIRLQTTFCRLLTDYPTFYQLASGVVREHARKHEPLSPASVMRSGRRDPLRTDGLLSRVLKARIAGLATSLAKPA